MTDSRRGGSDTDSHPELTLRAYDARDAEAVWTLHEWALSDAGTDPADVPGTDDLRRVEAAYLDTGGAFLVGVIPADSPTGETGASDRRPPETFDGRLVAMGGFVPTEAGRAEERSVGGAVELHRMRVAPTHQCRGYGRVILHALEDRARDAGFGLVLATTASRQAAAVEFYPSEGYRVVDRSSAGAYELVHFEKEL
ncbi:GNAT family N-acetyltransferase [Salinirubrum litoreum]|uniref:GNAT family N-acetyltransferase n=1 Tax=Salinirubrum litoreum TaxID=1126234 RepID=A0ABD5REM7_9EURY